jgi:hypothetical protein
MIPFLTRLALGPNSAIGRTKFLFFLDFLSAFAVKRSGRFRPESAIGALTKLQRRGILSIGDGARPLPSKGQRPVTRFPSRNRSGRSSHHRPWAATTGSVPPAAGSVRSVSGPAANSMLAKAIGDGDPAKQCQKVPRSATSSSDPRWAMLPSLTNEPIAHAVPVVPLRDPSRYRNA